MGRKKFWFVTLVVFLIMTAFSAAFQAGMWADSGRFRLCPVSVCLRRLSLRFVREKKQLEFFFGYRALYQDCEDRNGPDLFKYDATMDGPIIGLGIAF